MGGEYYRWQPSTCTGLAGREAGTLAGAGSSAGLGPGCEGGRGGGRWRKTGPGALGSDRRMGSWAVQFGLHPQGPGEPWRDLPHPRSPTRPSHFLSSLLWSPCFSLGPLLLPDPTPFCTPPFPPPAAPLLPPDPPTSGQLGLSCTREGLQRHLQAAPGPHPAGSPPREDAVLLCLPERRRPPGSAPGSPAARSRALAALAPRWHQ